MIKVIEGQIVPENQYSKKYIECLCDCGNTFSTMWTNISQGDTKSCGSCKIYLWKKSGQIHYGKLTLQTPVSDIIRLKDKAEWSCECGKTKSITLVSVLGGKAQSCGCLNQGPKKSAKQEIRTFAEWKALIPALIQTPESPESWGAGSSHKFTLLCKCGRHYQRKFSRFNPKTADCGLCKVQLVKNGLEINGFVYYGPTMELQTDSIQRADFQCHCGKVRPLKLREVFGAVRKTCGDCNTFSVEELQKMTFGKLRMVDLMPIKKNSAKKLDWLCICGSITKKPFYSVWKGATGSCGQCKSGIDNWWIQNRELVKTSKFPLQPDDPAIAPWKPKEVVRSTDHRFDATCPVCKSIYKPKYNWIRNGGSLTCGCTANQTSLAQREIHNFIQSLGLEAELEYKVKDLKYDIFIPSKNLLIEYQGLKWHSMPDARARDARKHKTAIEGGFEFLSLFEDEWRGKCKRVKDLIRNRVGLTPASQTLRPSKCQIELIGLHEADAFYELHHYIGKARASVNYAVKYEGRTIGCCSFKHPTRQSTHKWELVRMASDPEFRVHGIWSKILRRFVRDNPTPSIVSFSDNRLFPGGVYEKIGFKHDGNIPPDYYWVRDKIRHHKSGLRKKKGEDLTKTETQLRTAQGYFRVYDLGKKRWIWKPE